MADISAIRAGRAYVEIFTDNNPLSRGLRAAEQKLRNFGMNIRTMGIDLAAAGTAIITPLLTAAKMAGNMAMELWTMSQRTGISIEQLTALNYAAQQCGVSSELLDKAIRYMSRSMLGAALGSKELQQTFQMLGLDIAKFQNLSVVERLLLFADAFSKVKDPTERAALALKIFGRGGTAMLPFLDAGIAKIRELMENAARLHIVLSTEDVIAAMKFNQELRTLWASIKIGIFRVGSALIPVLSDWAKKLIDMIAVIAEFIKQNSGIVVSALYIGAGLLIAGTALIAFGTIVNSVSKILSVVRTALNAFMIVLNLAFSPLGLVVGIVLEIIVILGYWGDILDWLGNKFGLLKSDALEAFEGIAAALAAGDIGLAARILWLTLKTEWQKGTVALLTIWVEFKRTFLELWDGLGYAMILSWDTAVYGIKIAWAETIAFLKKLTLDWKTTFADVLDWITSKILQVFHPEYSAEKIQEVLEKRKAERWTAAGKEKELSTIEAEKKSAEEKAAKTYEEQKTAIGESYGRDLEKIGKGAAEGQKEIEDTQKGLDETAKQLQESIKRAKKEAAGGMPGMPGKAPTMPNLSLAMEKATAFGTFGAFGLKEIGVGGIGQQMVDLLSDIKGSNRDIADNTEEGSEFT